MPAGRHRGQAITPLNRVECHTLPVDSKPVGNQPKAPIPANPALYPDLAEAGSLADALERAATAEGVDIAGAHRSQSDPLRCAVVTSLISEREGVSVILGSIERVFIISAWSRGIQALSGNTADLREVARIAAAWRTGEPLRGIQSKVSFPLVKSLAVTQEDGGATAVVALAWHRLRKAAAEQPTFEPFGNLVEAAYARPELRVLFPFTSHGSLHLSQCTGYPFTWTLPFVDHLAEGRYLVCGPTRRDVIGEADTADQAVTLVAANLPGGCGPAVAGTANDL